jgi:hypothetical protein
VEGEPAIKLKKPKNKKIKKSPGGRRVLQLIAYLGQVQQAIKTSVVRLNQGIRS